MNCPHFEKPLIEVGKDDDSDRLRAAIEDGKSGDHLGTACEVAIAFIRFAQDLKADIEEQRQAGYL